MAFPLTEREWKWVLSVVSSNRGPTFMTSLNLLSKRPRLQTQPCWGFSFNIWIGKGTQTSWSLGLSLCLSLLLIHRRRVWVALSSFTHTHWRIKNCRHSVKVLSAPLCSQLCLFWPTSPTDRRALALASECPALEFWLCFYSLPVWEKCHDCSEPLLPDPWRGYCEE